MAVVLPSPEEKVLALMTHKLQRRLELGSCIGIVRNPSLPLAFLLPSAIVGSCIFYFQRRECQSSVFFFIVYILSKSVLKVRRTKTACEWDTVRKTRKRCRSFPLRGLNLVLFFCLDAGPPLGTNSHLWSLQVSRPGLIVLGPKGSKEGLRAW